MSVHEQLASYRSQVSAMTPWEATDFLRSRIAALEEDTLEFGASIEDVDRLQAMEELLEEFERHDKRNCEATK